MAQYYKTTTFMAVFYIPNWLPNCCIDGWSDMFSFMYCRTLLKQETVVTVKGIPLSGYLEGIVTDSIQSNANKVFFKSQPMWKGYLSHRRTAKAQTSLCIRSVLPEPSRFEHIICMEIEEESHLLPYWVSAQTHLNDQKRHDAKVPFLMTRLSYSCIKTVWKQFPWYL